MANAFASFIGGATSAIGNMIGAYQNYKYQKKLQQHQYDLQIKGLKESPTATRFGLEQAGYNPIMALGNTNAYATGGSASGVTQSTLGSDISSGATNALQRKQYEANVVATNAQAGLSNEQAKTEQAKRTNLEFQNRMLDVEKHLKQKDLDTYERRFYVQLYEQMQRAENYRAMANLQGYNAESQRIASNAQMLGAQTNRELGNYEKDRYRLEKLWRSRHPYQANWQAGVSNYASSIGSFLRKR